MFKLKEGYKLELQIPQTMKSFGATKKLIDKKSNVEEIPSFKAVEVVFVQCNLVDNKYQ